ncbi:MAG: peptidase prolyl oligopeptidase active site domain protein [Caulobacter sp.]|nr:peptidase prolyl oligopeptidase active site domain protein [Caulobacter sp.]
MTVRISILAGALVAAVGLFVAPAAPQAADIPHTPPAIDAYTHLPHLEQVAISPDGTELAYIGQSGDDRIIIVQTLTGQALGGARLGDTKVRDVQWGDDTHVLITTATWGDAGGAFSEKSDLLQAVSYNIVTKKIVTLLSVGHGTSMAGDANRPRFTILGGAPFMHTVRGKTVIYAVGYDRNFDTRTFAVDPDTGGAYPADEAGFVQDADGRAPVREEGYWNNTNATYTWRLTARDGVGWRELWRVDGNKIEAPDLVGRGRGKDTVFVRLPEDGRGTLYEVSMATGARKKLKFEGDPRSISPMYDSLTDELIGYETFGGEGGGDVIFLDAGREQAWQSVAAAFDGSTITVGSHTADYTKFVVFTSSDEDPGTYWLADTAAHKAFKIGSQYPGLKPGDVAAKTFVHYKAADGMELYGYLTLPVGRDPKNLPLIVIPHGGPQSHDDSDFDWFSQVIASRGYAVFQPQFRGSEGWGRDYFMAGQGEWGRKMQTDLSDGVRYLAKEGTIDPKRVCIFGWSYGGYAALAGATIDKGVYRCAAAGAPVTDLRKLLVWEKGENGSNDSPGLRYEKRYLGIDNINDPKLDTLSPALMADRVDIPILLIHGKQDSNVPYAQSVEMADALKRAGKPFDFVTLADEDHHLSKDSTRRQAFDAIIPFLEKNNPPY